VKTASPASKRGFYFGEELDDASNDALEVRMKLLAALAAPLLAITMSAQTATPAGQATPPPQSTSPENIGNTVPAPSTAGMTRDEALRADLTRMRAILYQMQNNLAFVQTTQSPLKHQFELDVEMWSAMIGHMERTLGSEHGNPPPQQH
jgi:hypothetical protein